MANPQPILIQDINDFALEHWNAYIKAKEVACKLAQVKVHKPVTLSREEVRALRNFFPDLDRFIDFSII